MTAAEAGRKGGLARAESLTAKQRTMAARKAALALWEQIRAGKLNGASK